MRFPAACFHDETNADFREYTVIDEMLSEILLMVQKSSYHHLTCMKTCR